MSYIWIDGNFFSSDEINIKELENSCYNTGIFEHIGFYNKKIFQLNEHLKRLIYSAKILFMDINFSFDNISQACTKLIEDNHLENGYIQPAIFINSRNISIKNENDISIAIFCSPRLNPYVGNINDKQPLRLEISSATKQTTDFFINHAKIENLYIANHIAKRTALDNGYNDALILDRRGFIIQATDSNLFIVKDGYIYTPPSEFCVNGITRQTVIKIAQENNIPIIEKHISENELFKADEAFLTKTENEINAILSINEYIFKSNPITQIIYSKFYQLTQG